MALECSAAEHVSRNKPIKIEARICAISAFVVGFHARHVDEDEAEAVLSLNNCSVLLNMVNNTLRNQKSASRNTHGRISQNIFYFAVFGFEI